MSFGASDRPVTKMIHDNFPQLGKKVIAENLKKYNGDYERWVALCEIHEYLGLDLPNEPNKVNQDGYEIPKPPPDCLSDY